MLEPGSQLQTFHGIPMRERNFRKGREVTQNYVEVSIRKIIPRSGLHTINDYFAKFRSIAVPHCPVAFISLQITTF